MPMVCDTLMYLENVKTQNAYAAVILKFIKQFYNYKQPKIHRYGKQSRGFTYIENFIEANLKA
jgi:UDP-N-acetylglucosamine/UDP-N-acetylgalactosamine 4-epimerase